MPKVVRKTDVNSGGGPVIGPCAPSVIVNGLPMSLTGDSVAAHPCCGSDGCDEHCNPVTTGGSNSVIAEGIKVQYIGGCVDTCGHPRAQGSNDVIIGT